MNEQHPPGGIEWTRIYGRRGFTCNPVKGCMHACRWRMPNGEVAICYAEAIANALNLSRYKQGFDHLTFEPKELVALRKLKTPSGVFMDSMSDLFGEKVQTEWIQATLDAVRQCPQHVCFSLTKNPHRLRDFHLPDNLWVGVSAPPTWMFGHELRPDQQQTWFRRALETLCDCSAKVRWVSLEPLSFDMSETLTVFNDRLHWAVIGAASYRNQYFQPDRLVFANVIKALEGVPVFFKGNIDLNLAVSVADGWRAEFPPKPWMPTQLEMESMPAVPAPNPRDSFR